MNCCFGFLVYRSLNGLLKFVNSVFWCSGNLSFTAFLWAGFSASLKVRRAQPGVQEGRRKSAAPLNFTLGAMRIMKNFSVLSVTDIAAGFVACSVLTAASLVVVLCALPVRRFSLFWRQCSVAELAPNFTLKRDAAEARRPLTPR